MTSWPRIKADVARVIEVVNDMEPGEYREITVQ